MTEASQKIETTSISSTPGERRQVMRKHMTRVLAEVMSRDKSIVYLGEDVIHGGYYVVTEGLVEQFPGRIFDWPPDETSLLGAAMGFAQVGITPIVEIPYAKYLDCGYDMFQEIAIQHWLSNGQQPGGMVIRLQGFDRGLFGGNFHTSNVLSLPPGIDVVCYSNGEDYVRGFRHAILQAKTGRVVMSVDCTHLLNLRHLHEKDRGWERMYPEADINDSVMGFDCVRRYGGQGTWAIVTYGNGVVTALQARRSLVDSKILNTEDEMDVIDCPYVSGVPAGLKETIPGYDGVVFADICKEGNNILSGMACALHTEGLLPKCWQLVSAPKTFNPLGNYCTFLNSDDMVRAFRQIKDSHKQD